MLLRFRFPSCLNPNQHLNMHNSRVSAESVLCSWAPPAGLSLFLPIRGSGECLIFWLLLLTSTVRSSLLRSNQASLCSGQVLSTSADFPTPTHNPGDSLYERFLSILYAATQGYIKAGICRIQNR